MRTFLPGIAALLLVLSSVVRAADEPAAPAAPIQPEQETKQSGTFPTDLEGRWLIVPWLDLPEGRTQTAPSLLEVTRDGDHLSARKTYLVFPPAQQAEIEAANSNGKTRWEPTADDLKQIAAAWDTLAPYDPFLKTVLIEFVGSDAFDEALKDDETSKGAAWMLRTVENFRAAPEVHSLRQASAHMVQSAVDGGYTGKYVALHLAAAPMPLPISFHGSFRLYRLGPPGTRPTTASTLPAPKLPAAPAPPPSPPPPRGLLARLLDLFSGCGKR